MGILLIMFGLSVLIFIISCCMLHYTNKNKTYTDPYNVGMVCSGIIGVLFLLFIIPFLINYCMKNIDMQKAYVQRGKLERLLNEDYNSKNLNNALDFNVEQKNSEIYNSSFFTYCMSNCYVIDTISIPNKKFTPTNELHININHDEVK